MAASDRGTGGGQVLLSLGVVVSQLVQVGVRGTSYWVADFHLPALRSHVGARVRAICGRDRRRAQALAEQHDVPEVYTDYRAMIDSSELDALVVVMPEDLHHPMVMAASRRACTCCARSRWRSRLIGRGKCWRRPSGRG